MRQSTGLAFAFGVALLLAGCATPLQQCLLSANQDVLDIQRELAERRANERRGYRIERILAPDLIPAMCPGPGGVPQPCMRWSQEPQEIYHRINRDLERERIVLLESQLQRAEIAAEQASAQCRAIYPED